MCHLGFFKMANPTAGLLLFIIIHQSKISIQLKILYCLNINESALSSFCFARQKLIMAAATTSMLGLLNYRYVCGYEFVGATLFVTKPWLPGFCQPLFLWVKKSPISHEWVNAPWICSSNFGRQAFAPWKLSVLGVANCPIPLRHRDYVDLGTAVLGSMCHLGFFKMANPTAGLLLFIIIHQSKISIQLKILYCLNINESALSSFCFARQKLIMAAATTSMLGLLNYRYVCGYEFVGATLFVTKPWLPGFCQPLFLWVKKSPISHEWVNAPWICSSNFGRQAFAPWKLSVLGVANCPIPLRHRDYVDLGTAKNTDITNTEVCDYDYFNLKVV